MGYWVSVRKGSVGVHVTYAHTFSNNLGVQDTRLWSDGPDVEIRMDLNGNLGSRTKQDNAYLDASELARGGIEQLSLLQTDDPRLPDSLHELLGRLEDTPGHWYLTLELEGEHRFEVEPKLKTSGAWQSLFLNVKGASAST